MKSTFAGALAIVAVIAATALRAEEPRTHTESGVVQGRTIESLDAFKGIPFAAPPIGALRWRAPQPPKTWTGVRDATAYGHDCMQTPFGGDAAPLGTEPAEDCLVLNVWRPAGTAGGAKLPVIVWIYGGGFVNGGSSPSVYDGSRFARKGVIMVSFNYRLGRFGFFGHPALTKENKDNGLLGNYGYMDQIAALKWVQRNIAAFGGDPSKVTIFGESAGGGSVHMLLTSHQSRGLFRGAIIESGGGRASLMGEKFLSTDTASAASAESLGVNFARKHGITEAGAAGLAQLRALPADVVNDGLGMMTMMDARETYSGPMIDGVIVKTSPQSAYLSGNYVKVPVIVGANDADLGFSFASSVDEAFAAFGRHANDARAAYDPEGKNNLAEINNKIGMDRMMIEPARFVASTLSAQGVPVYEYRFSYVADSMRVEWATGAPHATEIPYVMDSVATKYGDKLTEQDAKVADQTNSYWVNFAKTGNPNGPGLPTWPGYDPKQDVLMNFDASGLPGAIPEPLRQRLDVTAATADASR